MKTSRILAGAFLAGGLWSSTAFAQAPPAAPPAAANPAAALGAEPQPAGKMGFCEKIDKAIDRKRRKLCQIPLGQMLNSITKPLSAATGGIIPGFCPAKPSEEDTKKPGAEGGAAQALKDAVEAPARRKAVRLLGTFDCHWFPEAEAGLALALRTDRNECVRLEAAIALNRGCCCTRAIVEALEDCVAGTDKLGPSENSPRVQMVAQMALERCLTCPEATMIEEVAPPPPPVGGEKKERGETGEQIMPPRSLVDPGSAKPMIPPTAPPPPVPPGGPSYGPVSKKGSGKPSRELIEHAKQTLAMAQARQTGQARNPLAIGDEPLAAGQRSLAGLATYMVHGSGQKPAPVQTAIPPVAAPKTTPVVRTPERAPSFTSEPIKLKHAAPAPATETTPIKIDPSILRNLETLRDATDPEVRHKAVLKLASSNWREHPEAVSGLIYAARNDKHAGLRVACIRSLVTMKAGTPEVITGLKPMTSDADEWIRQETTKALTVLHPQTASIK